MNLGPFPAHLRTPAPAGEGLTLAKLMRVKALFQKNAVAESRIFWANWWHLRELGITPLGLQQAIKAGRIVRIDRGFYQVEAWPSKPEHKKPRGG